MLSLLNLILILKRNNRHQDYLGFNGDGWIFLILGYWNILIFSYPGIGNCGISNLKSHENKTCIKAGIEIEFCF